ncbi:alpha/beta hydrolase [Parvibaculum sp.]|uniref:alpha/beta hydrolase n=1 Tax=Parvibaculum sp. TaxID=2024848 RepID=UPI001B0C9BBD|nr:alpha/beta hydrolase [Parvibaculum sp.]MBO6633003.1 alpha/beta hydrolase [Parvibaculum sp.]MBO6679390.1 alpha/beta hydrolase [Parvibaculum sp.]MBO6684421.1 alpha/beta hydrolase [Parvibaculum sp.]MBO6904217.1 alpha/beta hydrolase [Parvibaculum sp.]
MTARTLDTPTMTLPPRARPAARLSFRGWLFNLAFNAVSRRMMRKSHGTAATFDVEDARTKLRSGESRMTAPPPGMQVTRVKGAPGAADWVTVPESEDDRTILFVHSGSFIFGQSKLHLSLAARICAMTRATALAVDYRIAPENPFPAAVEDVADAYEWLIDRGRAPDRIQILGDSAGGGIALGALLKLRERGASMPAAMTLLAPWADLTLSGRSILTNAHRATITNNIEILMISRELYLQGHTPADPVVSPVFADLTGMPKALIQASTADVLLDDSVRVENALHRAGVDVTLSLYPPMPHGWQRLSALLPESRKAVDEIGSFIGAHFERPNLPRDDTRQRGEERV